MDARKIQRKILKQGKKKTGEIAGFFRSQRRIKKAHVWTASGVLVLLFIVFNYGYFVTTFRYRMFEGVESFPVKTTISQQQAPVEEEDVLAPNTIRIDTLGIEAPIVYVDRINEGRFQEALQDGVVHYPLTAPVGEPGNTFIFGHSSDVPWRESPYRNVFALLPEIEDGSVIEVADPDGNVFEYIVTDTFIVSPRDVRVLEQGDGSKSLLTLQTSYPVGTALARFIVRAELRSDER